MAVTNNSINMRVAGNGGYLPVSTIGTGAPTIAGLVGDIYFDSVGGVGYTCTTSGAAGSAVWMQDFTNASAISWVNAAGNTPMSVNTYYLNQGTGPNTFTLPTTASVGARFMIQGGVASAWTLAQNAGQSVRVGAVTTTPGTAGSVASTNLSDTIQFTCIVANTTFSCSTILGNVNVA